jgi:hypothetical protein
MKEVPKNMSEIDVQGGAAQEPADGKKKGKKAKKEDDNEDPSATKEKKKKEETLDQLDEEELALDSEDICKYYSDHIFII